MIGLALMAPLTIILVSLSLEGGAAQRRLEVEESTSWRLFQQRSQKNPSSAASPNEATRVDAGYRQLLHDRPDHRLKSGHGHHEPAEGDDSSVRGIPKVARGTEHGLMIDAGSQGTRIHVYEYAARILRGREEIEDAVNGRKLSFPTTNARWTNRLKPGLDFFASIEEDKKLRIALRQYLSPLFDFAKTVLAPKRHRWAEFPVYLKATGGMRTLPTPDRIRVMAAVREILFDTKFNPFSFEEERARVISGEEEAIYGWAAVNFVKGTLLSDSEGTGTVLNPRKTFGMLEMGGASTQIGYYESNDDVMADLFKLQIGGARHWNVYCHSYLFFGINGAFDRLNARLYAQAGDDARSVRNPCLPGFSTVSNYSTWIHYNTTDSTLLPRSDPRSTVYTISLFNDDNKGDFETCDALVYKLLRKEANKNWVMFSHDGDCSFAGVYQPPLPINTSGFGEFIATSNYAEVWQFLRLPPKAPVEQVRLEARKICSMSLTELQAYNQGLPEPVHDVDLPELCFRSLFVFNMLHNGHGFPLDYKINAADVLNGQKLGWSLGSILYEINTLPWEFDGEVKVTKAKYGESNLWGLPIVVGSEHDTFHVGKQFVSLSVTAAAVVLVVSAYVQLKRRLIAYQRIA